MADPDRLPGAVRNLTRQIVLAACPRRAETVAWRMRGMIGRNFDGFDALIFPGCGNIHTFFMRMPLDVLFLDGHGRVRALRERLVPWRLCWIFGAQTVVELPAGVLARTGTRPGDEIAMA